MYVQEQAQETLQANPGSATPSGLFPPIPAPPPKQKSPEAATEERARSVDRSNSLAEALDAARALTLRTLRLTRPLGRGQALELAADLRRSTAGVALGLEARTARSLLTALYSLWRVSDLVDLAERRGLMELEAAVELLSLGSRVEVPLVRVLQRIGLGAVLESSR